MNNITIIVDYRNTFYSSTKNAKTLCSMSLDRLVACFNSLDFSVNIINFHEVNFMEDWSGRMIIYQSSEDSDLRYKSYIEDVIFGLSLKGAILLPEFKFLRAHHNKVFMEMLRDIIGVGTNLKSHSFGVKEDVNLNSLNYPVVAKTGYGAGSSGVKLIRDSQSASRIISKLMLSNSFDFVMAKELIKRIVRKGYVPYSLHRNKIIIQPFIPQLGHDYKVLIYFDSAFVVRREVRKNDFRASGSGVLSWPDKLPDGLLEFAWSIFDKCNVPYISLDIAYANNIYHMIEMQFVMFGPATLERSNHYWLKGTQGWKLIREKSDLEQVFADSIVKYIKAQSIQHIF
jgi:glutathione synthase/RimK-type ligase-like ATP-grasp enzyme